MSEDPQALGRRLKAERERRGMSTQKIANGMHLDEWVIDALEAGDYPRIGPAVYAKGHLKKYASLLGISLVPAGAEPPPPMLPVAAAVPSPIVRLDLPREANALWPSIGIVLAAALLGGGMFWWRQAHHAPRAPTVAAQPAARTDTPPSTAPAREDAGAVPKDAPPSASAADATARAPAAPDAHVTSAPSEAPLTPGVGRARLRLSFSADSWVDIRDYSGKRVFEGNGRANSVKTVAGMAPFRVYLRYASGVQLQLNDRAVAIGRQFISGEEARFEAGADGVLRHDSRGAPANGARTAAVSPHG
jgi:cytoskeleton protein RodZ